MAALRLNISGSTAVDNELLAPKDRNSLNSILMTNSESGGQGVEISLRLELPSEDGKSLETYYILRNTVIPGGASLLLDDPGVITYDMNRYSLILGVESGNDLTVTIR